MYKKNCIVSQIETECDPLMRDIIYDALVNDYAVFHIEEGKDENRIPYVEIGICKPKEFNLVIPQPDYNTFILTHEVDAENEKEVENCKKWLKETILPMLKVSITFPDQLSEVVTTGVSFNGNESSFHIRKLTKFSTAFDIIIRVSYQPELWKSEFENPGFEPIGERDAASLWYLSYILNPENKKILPGAMVSWRNDKIK